jgi:UDP-N-acetylmuramoyl-tripeptide--D-alanyl-D-alanine ligase
MPGAPMAEAALWTSAEIAAATSGTVHGGAFRVDDLSIDSRTLKLGDLFVALNGARDGADFAGAAFASGAAAVLTARPVEGGPYILVDDALAGLERLAVVARDRSPARRAAVTGSVGKTSVTQAIAAGIALAGRSHAPVKSFNNHIGVPLTLARMPAATERAVFELGMNHADEIRPLSRLVRPDVALVTTVGAVHTENFPDGEIGVARAKAEIFEGLAPGGVAVLNADNVWAPLLSDAARANGARIVTFGESADCDAQLIAFERGDGAGAVVVAKLHGQPLRFQIAQTGVHWGPNSLAALLVLEALNVPRDQALAALATFAPLAGRGADRRLKIEGGEVVLIDESYNANPLSMTTALKNLGAHRANGRRLAVLTDMLELGPEAPSLHGKLATVIAEADVDLVFCAGPLMHALWTALPPGQRGAYAETPQELAQTLIAQLRPGDVVMIKGSNGSKASLIVSALDAAALRPSPAAAQGAVS